MKNLLFMLLAVIFFQTHGSSDHRFFLNFNVHALNNEQLENLKHAVKQAQLDAKNEIKTQSIWFLASGALSLTCLSLGSIFLHRGEHTNFVITGVINGMLLATFLRDYINVASSHTKANNLELVGIMLSAQKEKL